MCLRGYAITQRKIKVMCECECMCERKRERSTRMNTIWGMNYIESKYQISSSKYKNTFNEVYIASMCNGAHVCVEYRYKRVSPILNELRSGGSRISHISTMSYLRRYSQHF